MMDEKTKGLFVDVNEKGDLIVKPQNVSPDEVVGIVLRLAAQIKAQLKI